MAETDRLERTREDVRRASDLTEDVTVREQLRSIDEGLEEMTHSDAAEGDALLGDELEEVEKKLAALGDEAEGDAQARIQDARDRIDAYRREFTRDW